MLGTRRLTRPFLALLAIGPIVTSVLAASPTASATPTVTAPSGPWTVRWASQPSAAAPPTAGGATDPFISANGKVVTFTTGSRLSGDGSPYPGHDQHAFLSRVGASTPVRLAVVPGGGLGNGSDTGDCYVCTSDTALTADGRTAFFTSLSTNLTPGDTNGMEDVFRRDLRTGAVTLVSHAADGGPADGASTNPQTSDDGRWVLFASTATNLGPDVLPPGYYVYLHDTLTDRTRLISQVSPVRDGVTLSSSGATLLVVTQRQWLPQDDPNGQYDTYVVDLATGGLTLASVNNAGRPLHGTTPSISDDGTTVAFRYYDRAAAAGVVAVRDLTTGRTTTVPGSQGFSWIAMSGDGRRIAGLRSTGPDGLTTVTQVIDRSGLVLYQSTGAGGLPSIDRDGSCIAFSSPQAEVPADVNGREDVYTACQG